MRQQRRSLLWTFAQRRGAIFPIAGSRPLESEAGQSLVEFALVFILFMMLLFGIAGFGHALYAYHFVSHAAKSAARWAAVNGWTCQAPISSNPFCSSCDNTCNGNGEMGNTAPAVQADVQSYVTSHTPPGIDSKQINATLRWPVQAQSPTICSAAVTDPATGNSYGPYTNYPGCTVQVTVSYNFKFIFPLISPSSLNLSSTSEMVIAH